MLIEKDFPVHTWNMYDRLKAHLPRTNNSVESFHSTFSNDIVDHPPITVLSSKYRKVQHKHANKREHHIAGRKMPTMRKKYKKVNTKLRSLVTRLVNSLIAGFAYLGQIAKIMSIRTE